MQRTLNRELKEFEIAGRDALVTCVERRSGRVCSSNGTANHRPIGIPRKPVRPCAWASKTHARAAGSSPLPQLGRPSRYQLGFQGHDAPLLPWAVAATGPSRSREGTSCMRGEQTPSGYGVPWSPRLMSSECLTSLWVLPLVGLGIHSGAKEQEEA